MALSCARCCRFCRRAVKGRAGRPAARDKGGIGSGGGAAITCQDAHVGTFRPEAQPRAIGTVALGAASSAAGSVLATLHQGGALRALFPRRRDPALQAILVNTAGGITGGDRFSTRLSAGPGSWLRVTTQGAERAYRAQPGEVGQVETRASVAPGARLDWLPQETILYDGCALRRGLTIDLAPDARLLMVEALIFGRAAMGETLGQVRFRDRITITRAGAPLYADAMALDGDAAAHLARPAVARGAGAMASLVLVAPDAEAHLSALRAVMPGTGGVSLIRPDLLAMRLLAPDGFALRQVLVPVLTRLTDNGLPRSWMT